MNRKHEYAYQNIVPTSPQVDYNSSRYMLSYPYSGYGHYNELFSYKSPAATNLNSHRSNYQIEENYQMNSVLINEEKVNVLRQRQ